MYRYISYYKPALEKEYIFHDSVMPLDFPSRNESVLMVPGSVLQMQQDMDEEDHIENRFRSILDRME